MSNGRSFAVQVAAAADFGLALGFAWCGHIWWAGLFTVMTAVLWDRSRRFQ